MLVSSMKFEDSFVHDLSRLTRKLLQVLLQDDVKEDTDYQVGIRMESERITSVEESPETVSYTHLKFFSVLADETTDVSQKIVNHLHNTLQNNTKII